MKNWYVVHTQTGSEEKVKTSLENKISQEGMQDFVGKVIIPTEQVSEVRSGKKKISKKSFFKSSSFSLITNYVLSVDFKESLRLNSSLLTHVEEDVSLSSIFPFKY